MMPNQKNDPTIIDTGDGPVVVDGGVVTLPDTLAVKRRPKAAPVEQVRRQATTPGAAVLEHAYWCRPQPGEAECRVESFKIRNDTTGVLFETTRCIECAAQVNVNLASGQVNATPGDNSFVPQTVRTADLEQGDG